MSKEVILYEIKPSEFEIVSVLKKENNLFAGLILFFKGILLFTSAEPVLVALSLLGSGYYVSQKEAGSDKMSLK